LAAEAQGQWLILQRELEVEVAVEQGGWVEVWELGMALGLQGI
jgi:hypothetical protein